MPSITMARMVPKDILPSRASAGTTAYSFWLRQGNADAKAAHIGFVAKSEAEVNAFYEAAMAAGETDNGKPGARLYYDPRYYAANLFDPDGYSLEAVYKELATPPMMQPRNLKEPRAAKMENRR
jgi:hypothetical protein